MRDLRTFATALRPAHYRPWVRRDSHSSAPAPAPVTSSKPITHHSHVIPLEGVSGTFTPAEGATTTGAAAAALPPPDAGGVVVVGVDGGEEPSGSFTEGVTASKGRLSR